MYPCPFICFVVRLAWVSLLMIVNFLNRHGGIWESPCTAAQIWVVAPFPQTNVLWGSECAMVLGQLLSAWVLFRLNELFDVRGQGYLLGWMCWCRPMIPALWNLRKEGLEFDASLLSKFQ